MVYPSWEKGGIMRYQTLTIGKNASGFKNQVVFSLQWEELEPFIDSLAQLRDSGFEIRDCISYLYGSGFPKSHNFGCKCTGDPVPYGHEKAQSSFESHLRSLPKTNLSSEINFIGEQGEVLLSFMQDKVHKSIGLCPSKGLKLEKNPAWKGGVTYEEQGKLHRPEVCEMSPGISSNGTEGRVYNGTSISDGQTFESNSSEDRSGSSQGSQYQKQQYRKSRIISRQQNSQNSGVATCEKCGGLKDYKGHGTALKPAWEPCIIAMKPIDGTFKQNAEKWGQAGFNIDGCRVESDSRPLRLSGDGSRINTLFDGGFGGSQAIGETSKGRWPANVILDEEAGNMLDEQSGFSKTPSQTFSGPSGRHGKYSPMKARGADKVFW